MRSTVSDEWATILACAELRSFADRLYVPEGLEDQDTLPIVVVLDEIRRWALLSQDDAWRSGKNRASLRLELTHAMNGCGGRLSSHMSSKLHNIQVALCSVAKVRTESSAAGDPTSDRPDRSAVIGACEAAQEALQSDASVELALLDLIEAAMSDAEAVVISRLRAVIVASLEERGIDGQRQLSTAIAVLNSSALETEIVLSDIDELAPGPLTRNVDRISSDEGRVQIVREFLLAPASIHRCVAWLQFQVALVREREIDAGDVLIFRATDIIHSALEPNAVSVSAFAKEIREVFGHSTKPVNYTRLHEQSVALVRVDLGSRPLHGALRTAQRAVNTLIELSVAQNHGVEWAPYGRQTLLVDGRATQFESSRISRVGQHNHDYENVHGMNQTASGLAEWGNKISSQLLSGKSSEYLSEAISLQAQAATLRNSDERFGGTKTSVERSIITLDDRVVELVGSFGRIPPSSLVDYAFGGWAMATWHSEVNSCIRRALDHRSRGDLQMDQDIYSSIIRWDGERQIVSYVNASKYESYLLSIDESEHLTEFMASRLASLRDAETFLALYASYIQQGDLVKSRLRRVRNAVVHGNPASDAAIALACDASRYASESAISRALEQLTSGESMTTSYEEQAAHRESQLLRLKSGDSWIDIWSATA